MKNGDQTKFASPGRSTEREIAAAAEIFASEVFLINILDAVPDAVMVLDGNRQIVCANRRVMELTGGKGAGSAFGKRPGELFGCVNAWKESCGCGTSEFCRECGAVRAILSAQDGKLAVQECRLFAKDAGKLVALDLRVWAVPFSAGGRRFTVFTLKDIGDEKRRTALEQVFYHDVLNDAAVLRNTAEIAREGIIKPDKEFIAKISRCTEKLIDSVQSQKDILAAERGELRVIRTVFDPCEVLRELADFYGTSRTGRNRAVSLKCPAGKGCGMIETDRVLFWRVMGNLIKNALEATDEGGEVTAGCADKGGGKTFFVNNAGVVPDNVRLQVFQRSFSTKGEGRGLGTYSVKLFAEQFLGGKVWFGSDSKSGTTFYVELP